VWGFKRKARPTPFFRRASFCVREAHPRNLTTPFLASFRLASLVFGGMCVLPSSKSHAFGVSGSDCFRVKDRIGGTLGVRFSYVTMRYGFSVNLKVR
jgi:hypothetical protein